MLKELKYITFNTDAGWVGILSSPEGLLATTLPGNSAGDARRMLGNRVDRAVPVPEFFTGTVQRLRAYFNGERVEFSEKLDLSEATPFQRAVWEKTRLIPYGETRSYLWVAGRIGKPEIARAVGQALGRNPLPIIIPCHRVVGSNGKLGGFTGGLDVKRRLLRLEVHLA